MDNLHLISLKYIHTIKGTYVSVGFAGENLEHVKDSVSKFKEKLFSKERTIQPIHNNPNFSEKYEGIFHRDFIIDNRNMQLQGTESNGIHMV